MSLFYKVVQMMLAIPALQNIRILFYFYDSIILRFLPKPKKKEAKPKVLVVFTLSLGDAVMFYGTIKYLMCLYPKEKYDVILTCHEEYQELFDCFFSEILPVDYRKVNIDPGYRIKFLKKIRQTYYDIAVDPIGCEECSPNLYVMNAVCANTKIGVLSKQDKRYQSPAWLRNRIYDVVLKEDKNVHKVKYYTSIWSLLAEKDYPPAVAKLSFEKSIRLPEKYFVVYPSASVPAKMWPVERFAEIAKRIWEEKKWHLTVCGKEQDREITEKLLQITKDIPTLNLVGKTNISQFVEVIGRAKLVLTNDTSAYHIAVGCGRKTCVVSGGYVYDQFLDYLSNDYRMEADIRIAAHKSDCMNCNNHCSKYVEKVYPCVLENTIEEVWSSIKELLADQTKEAEERIRE